MIVKNMMNRFKTQLLDLVLLLFKQYNIEYCLMCGTLLGCIRDGKFIDWDNDIDLGVFSDSWYKLKKMEKFCKYYGINMYRHFDGYWGYHYKIKAYNVSIDIFPLHIKKDDKILFQYNWKNMKMFRKMYKHNIVNNKTFRLMRYLRSFLIPKPMYHILPNKNTYRTIDCLFNDELVKIPFYSTKWLEILYGKDWRVPKPDYKFSDERDKNIKKVK